MDAGTSGVGNCRHAASARFSTSQALRQRPHRARCVSIAAHTLGLMSPSRCCEKSVTTSGHIESRGSSLRLPNIGASAWRTATLARCNRLASFARLRSGRFRWLWNVMVGEGPTQDALVRLAPAFDLIAVGTCRRHGPQRWWLGSVAEAVVRQSARPVLDVAAEARVPDTRRLPRIRVAGDAGAAVDALGGLRGSAVRGSGRARCREWCEPRCPRLRTTLDTLNMRTAGPLSRELLWTHPSTPPPESVERLPLDLAGALTADTQSIGNLLESVPPPTRDPVSQFEHRALSRPE